MNSKHWTEDRKERNELIKKIGKGEIVKTVEVDRNHPNGPEIHEISSTGIITIYNKRTHIMITQLIARPGQIRRYYNNEKEIPKELIEIALKHQKMAFNLK